MGELIAMIWTKLKSEPNPNPSINQFIHINYIFIFQMFMNPMFAELEAQVKEQEALLDQINE